jgi:lipoate-protein ligase A
MELDLALLELAAASGTPVLRLYAWDGPWVSLGHFQKRERVVRAVAGVGVVQRPTGGKALLHDGDLTYSVALPADHALAKLSVADSYRALCEPLLRALGEVGVPATLGLPDERPVTERRSAVPCATEVHIDTVLVRGRKLVGSAQVRRHGAVLQHGSIPIKQSTGEVLAALAPPGQAVDEAWVAWYRERTTTLEREGCGDVRGELQAALVRAFAAL